MSIKNKLAAVACGLALVGTVAAPVAALAAQDESGNVTGQTTGTTNVTVQTDPSGTQLSFTVPTIIPFYVANGGTMITASGTNLKIVNNSVFPIHVSKVKVAAVNPFTVTSTDTTENGFDFTLDGVKASDALGEDGVDYTPTTLGYAGSAQASHPVAVKNGKINKVTEDISSAKNAATITWTLASGKAQ